MAASTIEYELTSRGRWRRSHNHQQSMRTSFGQSNNLETIRNCFVAAVLSIGKADWPCATARLPKLIQIL